MVKSIKRTRISFKNNICIICYNKFKIRGLLDSCEHIYCLRCIKAWTKIDESHRCPACKQYFKKVFKKIGNKISKKNLIINNRIIFRHSNVDYLFIYESDSYDQNYENRINEEVIKYSLFTNCEDVPIDLLKIIFDENFGNHFGNKEINYSDVIEKIRNAVKIQPGEDKIFLQSIHFSVNAMKSYEALVCVSLSNYTYPVYIPFQKYISL